MCNSNDKKEKKPGIMIGPVEVNHKIFYGGVATLALILIELQKLTMLDVPVGIALSGFDALAAALSNVGLLILLAALSALLMGSVFASLILLIWFGLMLDVVFRRNPTQIKAGVLGTLVAVTKSENAASNSNPSEKVSWWKRFRQSLSNRHKRVKDLAKNEKEKYQNELHSAANSPIKWYNWLVQTFIRQSDKSLRAKFWRSGAFVVLIALVLIANGLTIHHKEKRMYATAQSSKGSHLAKRSLIDGLHSFLDHPSVVTDATVFSALRSKIAGMGQIIAPDPRSGYLTYTRAVSQSAAHLSNGPHSAPNAKFQRSERVFYIGDFGEWTYVALFDDPDKRLFIRRSNLMEFSKFPAPKRNTPPPEPNELAALRRKVDKLLQKPDPAPQIVNLSNSIRDIRTIIGSLNGGTLVPREPAVIIVRVPPLPDPTVSKELKALSSQLNETRNSFSTHLRVARRLRASQETAWRNALEQQNKAQREALDSFRTSYGRLLREQVVHSNQLASLKQKIERQATIKAVEAKIDTAITLIKSKPSGTPSSGAEISARLAETLREGLTTRTGGVANDMERQFGAGIIDTCINLSNTLPSVDFAEGSRRGNFADVNRLVTTLQRLSATKTRGVVLLRGGASYTGAPSTNMALSEARAEWVKRVVLQKLTNKRINPTNLEKLVEDQFGLRFVAYGIGERVSLSNRSARTVEAMLCQKKQLEAQRTTGTQVTKLAHETEE